MFLCTFLFDVFFKLIKQEDIYFSPEVLDRTELKAVIKALIIVRNLFK